MEHVFSNFELFLADAQMEKYVQLAKDMNMVNAMIISPKDIFLLLVPRLQPGNVYREAPRRKNMRTIPNGP